MDKPRESPARVATADAARQMEAIMASHEAVLLRYASGILGDSHAAQDVVQTVFIKLFQNWKPGLHETDAIRGWLYRATHNAAVDHVRRESRRRLFLFRQAKEAVDPDPVAPANPGLDRAERIRQVLAHIRKLDFPERQVVLLRLQEGLSYADISRITGRSEGNVGFILHHAVKKLARWVKGAADAA